MCTITVYGGHTFIQIPSLFTQFLKGNQLNEMWHVIQISLNAYFRQFVKKIFISMCDISGIYNIILQINLHGSHTLINIPSHFTEFLKENDQNPPENPCTWVTTLSTKKFVTNTFISWSEKTKKRKEIATCGNCVSLSSSCEQAAAVMVRAFSVCF